MKETKEAKTAAKAKSGKRVPGMPKSHSDRLRRLSEWLAEEGYQGMVLLSRDYMDEDATRVCAYVSGSSDALAECMLSPLGFMEDAIDKIKYCRALGKAVDAVVYALMRAGADADADADADVDEWAFPAPAKPEA